MRRRELMLLVGGAMIVGRTLRAQLKAMPRNPAADLLQIA
jgi:hypothetical protein